MRRPARPPPSDSALGMAGSKDFKRLQCVQATLLEAEAKERFLLFAFVAFANRTDSLLTPQKTQLAPKRHTAVTTKSLPKPRT